MALRSVKATWHRPQARQSGRLEAGYDAEIIALDADPLTDRSAWADRNRVTHVWTADRLVKTLLGVTDL